MFPAHWLFQGTLQREKLEQLSQMICTVKTARFIIAVIGLISQSRSAKAVQKTNLAWL